MKIVLYTQRVDIVEGYGERRDCADQNIARFIKECGYLPIPVPNVMSIAAQIINELIPAGIIFTGGNSLVSYGGNAPERDETENRMLEIALQKDIPVYGICRGMQVILNYFGNELVSVANHVAVRHLIDGEQGMLSVNSYHNLGCKALKDPLKVLAMAQDGVIESIYHKDKKILATMWHPERENPFGESDKKRVRELFL